MTHPHKPYGREHSGGPAPGAGRGGGNPPTDLPPIDLHCDPNTFIQNAQKWAKKWSDGKATKSQVRRFYGEVRRLDQLIKSKGEPGWKEHELEFRMLKPKAAYAKEAAGKAPHELTQFIRDAVDRVKSKGDFELFVKLFEAVVGFAYSEGLGDRN